MKSSLSKWSATVSRWLHFEISNFVTFVQNYWSCKHLDECDRIDMSTGIATGVLDIVIVTGNPGVFQGYPYPYPGKPVPAPKGKGPDRSG